MAKSFNQAIVMGNLTRDPELRSTTGGQQVASFAVATNRTWNTPSGERQEAVEYHEIVAWGKLGELAAQYLAKGRKVLIVGRLQTQSWEKDGVKRQRTEIVAADINFLDGRNDGGDGQYDSAPTAAPASKPAKAKTDEVVIQDLDETSSINLDDIPF
jgi:single-strand DNA-binding protein